MSFNNKNPATPGMAATDGQQFSSYQAGEPVGFNYGRDVWGSKWLCQPYAWREAGDSKTAPKFQYCSIAARYRVGVVDYVGWLLVGGKRTIYLNYFFDVGEEFHDFDINPTILGRAGFAWTLRLYRGTRTQPRDTDLCDGTGQNHPAYRGWCWGLFKNMELGAGSTQILDIALELGSKTPAIGGFGVSWDGFRGVNPFAAIYALARTQAGGPRASATLFDDAHWAAQCAALETTGIGQRKNENTYCHPNFSKRQDFGTAVAEVLSYVDGFIYYQAGKLRVGWYPNATPSAAGLPEIAEGDLQGEPGGNGFGDWSAGPSSVALIYRDPERNYTDSAAIYHAPATSQLDVPNDPARKERPFCHDVDQANIMAAEAASDPNKTDSGVTLTVLKSRAVDGGGALLLPGALINWDYSPHSLDLVCRVVERRLKMGAAADTIKIVRERSAFPRPYVAAADDRIDPTPESPDNITSGMVRLWTLPSGFGPVRQVAVLIDRPSTANLRAEISLSANGSAPWEMVLSQQCFAAKVAIITTALTNVATTVRVTTSSVDFARMAAQSALSQVDDTLLLLFENEVVSVGSITAVSTGVYDLTILRARQGTAAAAHATTVVGWVFIRAELESVVHREFQNILSGGAYDATTATKYFKIALATKLELGTPQPAGTGLSLTLPDPTPATPTGLFATGGASVDFNRPPYFYGREVALAFRVNWTPVPGALYYEWISHITADTDADAEAQFATVVANPADAAKFFPRVSIPEAIVSAQISLGAIYFRVRAVGDLGLRSAWANGGGNLNSYYGRPAGTLSNQNADAAAVTGISTGNGSSVRKVWARYQAAFAVTLAGGAPTETYNLSLTNRGFSAAPDVGFVTLGTNPYVLGSYNSSGGGNSAANAVLFFYSNPSSANLAAATHWVMVELIEYEP